MRPARRGGPSLASLSALAVVGVLAVAGRAAAAEKMAMALDFGAEVELVSCPSVVEFRQEVVRHLGRDPFRADAPRRLVVRFYVANARMEGRIEWRDPSGQWEGERTFASRDSSCRNMGRAVAFAAAIQIQIMAADEGARPPPPLAAPAPAAPPPPVVAVAAAPPPVAALRGPALTVDVGLGATVDGGGVPAMALPRIGVWLGQPSRFSARIAAHGLGPGVEVRGAEGTAHLNRLLITVDVTHAFRAERVIQPVLAVGAGVQHLSVHGISARPDLASGHDDAVVSGVLTISGGVMFALVSRVSLVGEVQALLFRPAVHINVGSNEVATLDGLALFGHGGLLARF